MLDILGKLKSESNIIYFTITARITKQDQDLTLLDVV